MIANFRKLSESWWFKGFLLFMALAFAFMWGVGDWTRQLYGRTQSVVQVGSDTITVYDFYKELERVISRLQIQSGQAISEERARSMGLFEVIRDQMINHKLLELEAKRLGLMVTDEEVTRTIKTDKLFHTEEGQFDRARFESLISRLGFSEKTYVEELRKDLLRSRLVNALSMATKIPLSMALPIYSWQNEKRTVTGVMIESKDIAFHQKATEDDLRAFYEDQKSTFNAPEYRRISILLVDQKTLMDGVSLTKEELEVSFRHRAEEFTGRTFEDVKEMVADDLKRQKTLEAFDKLINDVDDRLGQGRTLEDIAKEFSLKLETFRVDGKGAGDPFRDEGNQANPLPESLGKTLQEAFQLGEKETSALIENMPTLSTVVYVDAIDPAGERSFETVRSKLGDYWRQSKKLDRMRDMASDLAAEMNKGTLPAVLAKQKGLKLVSAGITRSGSSVLSSLKLSQPLIDRLFSLAVGEAMSAEYSVEKGKEAYLALQILDKTFPNPKESMDAIKDLQVRLKDMYVDDIISLYVFALRKRFPVDINKAFFKRAPKKDGAS